MKRSWGRLAWELALMPFKLFMLAVFVVSAAVLRWLVDGKGKH